MNHYKNPDYVVVDTSITIQAPPHLLVSGIGDALATYVEARASYANNNVNYVGGGGYRPTLLAMNLAKLSLDILLEKGRAAMSPARNCLPYRKRIAGKKKIISAILCSGFSI